MDRVVEEPHAEDGVVWIAVRVDGLRFKLGAASAGDWNAAYPGMDTATLDKARSVAKQWEREHPADAAALFAEALKAQPKPP